MRAMLEDERCSLAAISSMTTFAPRGTAEVPVLDLWRCYAECVIWYREELVS